MRRLTITFTATVMLLALAPVVATARGHHPRHHSRTQHVRVERFGNVSSSSSAPSSTDNAGTVMSFTNGVLTITLHDSSSGSSTVSGVVTNDTEIECMAPASTPTGEQGGDGDGGDHGGSGDNGGGGNQGDRTDVLMQSEDQPGGQDENETADEPGDEMGNTCTTANLTAGVVVRAAELRVSSAGSVWQKVELGS